MNNYDKRYEPLATDIAENFGGWNLNEDESFNEMVEMLAARHNTIPRAEINEFATKHCRTNETELEEETSTASVGGSYETPQMWANGNANWKNGKEANYMPGAKLVSVPKSGGGLTENIDAEIDAALNEYLDSLPVNEDWTDDAMGKALQGDDEPVVGSTGQVPKSDIVTDIMRYEDGEMSIDEIVKFFSRLIKSGMIGQLQGHYGRTAESLIGHGYLDDRGAIKKLPGGDHLMETDELMTTDEPIADAEKPEEIEHAKTLQRIDEIKKRISEIKSVKEGVGPSNAEPEEGEIQETTFDDPAMGANASTAAPAPMAEGGKGMTCENCGALYEGDTCPCGGRPNNVPDGKQVLDDAYIDEVIDKAIDDAKAVFGDDPFGAESDPTAEVADDLVGTTSGEAFDDETPLAEDLYNPEEDDDEEQFGVSSGQPNILDDWHANFRHHEMEGAKNESEFEHMVAIMQHRHPYMNPAEVEQFVNDYYPKNYEDGLEDELDEYINRFRNRVTHNHGMREQDNHMEHPVDGEKSTVTQPMGTPDAVKNPDMASKEFVRENDPKVITNKTGEVTIELGENKPVTQGTTPPGIVAVYDNDGETFDRYTVVFVDKDAKTGFHDMLGLSSNPTSPQGFSQWTSGQWTKGGTNAHLGKRIKFTDLPGNVQKHVFDRLKINQKDEQYMRNDPAGLDPLAEETSTGGASGQFTSSVASILKRKINESTGSDAVRPSDLNGFDKSMANEGLGPGDEISDCDDCELDYAGELKNGGLFKEVFKRKLREAKVPGLAEFERARNESGTENRSSNKESMKKVGDFGKPDNWKQEDISGVSKTPPKWSAFDEKLAEEIAQMSALSRGMGLTDIVYQPGVGKTFQDRAEMALKGDPKMGNSQDYANVWEDADGNKSKVGETMIKLAKEKHAANNDALKDAVRLKKRPGQTTGNVGYKGASKKSTLGENRVPVVKHDKVIHSYDDLKPLLSENRRVDGKRTKITDANGTEFLVQWDAGTYTVLSETNTRITESEMDRAKRLMRYKFKK